MTKQRRCPASYNLAAAGFILLTGAGFNKWIFGNGGTAAPRPAKPLRPKHRHGDHRHAVVARIGDAPLSNHDRQKRRRGILSSRIGEHFPLQRLEASRPSVCMSPSSRSGVAPATPPQATCHRSSAWGARERGPSSARTGVLSLAQARPKAQSLQANRPCNTSGQRHPAKLRHSQCSFYATFNAVFTPFGTQFPSASQRESASHSEQQFRGALRYLRSHISANEISLVSPLFAAASWHPRVKPRFEKIA